MNVYVNLREPDSIFVAVLCSEFCTRLFVFIFLSEPASERERRHICFAATQRSLKQMRCFAACFCCVAGEDQPNDILNAINNSLNLL